MTTTPVKENKVINDFINLRIDAIIVSAFREVDADNRIKLDVKVDYPTTDSYAQNQIFEFDSKFFDTSSQVWRLNKIKTGAFFKYKEPKKHAPESITCQYIHTKTGDKCRKYTEQYSAYSKSKHQYPTMLESYQLNETKLSADFCHQHRNRYKNVVD